MVKRVLAVDDSRTMRDMVCFTLRGAGFEVFEAEDGLKAIAALGNAKVDAIITDINMPNMDGISLIRKLRADGRHKMTPIVILTTESDAAKKAEGRAAGATAWLVKPFAPEKLIDVVNKICP
jgi:two-component system, chemotaxis family, chemotaxis protein CheY